MEVNMRTEVTLSPKGQITLPKEVRDLLQLNPGDVVAVSAVDGRLVLTPKNLDFNALAGLLGTPPSGPATLEEIDETIARAMAESATAPLSKLKDEAA